MINLLGPVSADKNVNVMLKNEQMFRILIVIPTLGERLDTLDRTLRSIEDQADVLVDTVLVTKLKTPVLLALADQYNATIIVHPGNISAAINAGFKQASETHKYANWIGDDDMLKPNALALASTLLEDNPSAVVAYGACDYIDRNGNPLFTRRPPLAAPMLLQFVPGLIKQEACLFRRSALQQIGDLDEKLKYTMDLDLLLRMRRIGSFVKTDQILAGFCWHAGSLTIANRKASLEEAQNVQLSHMRGMSRILNPLWKYPIKYLILIMNYIINNRVPKDNK